MRKNGVKTYDYIKNGYFCKVAYFSIKRKNSFLRKATFVDKMCK